MQGQFSCGVTVQGNAPITIYFMLRVPPVHLEYAHIQHLQEHLWSLVVVLGTSRWVDETPARQVLHCNDDKAKLSREWKIRSMLHKKHLLQQCLLQTPCVDNSSGPNRLCACEAGPVVHTSFLKDLSEQLQ